MEAGASRPSWSHFASCLGTQASTGIAPERGSLVDSAPSKAFCQLLSRTWYFLRLRARSKEVDFHALQVLCHFAKLASFVGVEDFGSAADDFVHIPYRAAQALLVLGDGPSWLHLPRIDMASFYRALEWSFRFDCSLIESVFLARQPDPKFQKKGGQLVARLRAKDGRPVVARRRSEAPRKVEFRVGDVFSWHKVEGVVAIVGWEWITLKHSASPPLVLLELDR